MQFRSGSMFVVLALSLVFRGSSPLSAADARQLVYEDVEGELTFVFDPGRMNLTLQGSPAEIDVDGRKVRRADIASSSYADCSSKDVTCVHVGEFALSVPRVTGRADWSMEDWRFRRTKCLDLKQQRCDRFSVAFKSDTAHVEGGFVFERSKGVEMFYHSDLRSDKSIRRIFVLSSEKGLLVSDR